MAFIPKGPERKGEVGTLEMKQGKKHPADCGLYALVAGLIRAEMGGKIPMFTQGQSETERMRASATPWTVSAFFQAFWGFLRLGEGF